MKVPIRARSARGGILAGFGFAATSLLLASTASACTTFVGFMTVTAGEGQSTVLGSGSGDHTFCQPPRPGAVATSGQTVIISVESAACGTTVKGLHAEAHYVAFNNAPVFRYNCAPGALCAADPNGYASTTANKPSLCTPTALTTAGNTGVRLNRPSSLGGGPAQFMTDSNGAGTVVAELPASLFANSVTPLEDASICVNQVDGGVDFSIMAPIHILL